MIENQGNNGKQNERALWKISDKLIEKAAR